MPTLHYEKKEEKNIKITGIHTLFDRHSVAGAVELSTFSQDDIMMTVYTPILAGELLFFLC